MRYLLTGVKPSHDPEFRQQVMLTNLFGFIGYFNCSILGIVAIWRSDWNLAAVLLTFCGIFFSTHLILRSKSIVAPYKLASSIVTISLMLIMIYLVFSGGLAGTGPLWIFIVPPMAFFFGGIRKGSIYLGIFVLTISVLMFYPDDKLLAISYSYEFKSRLIYSFLTVSCSFAFYEYARQESFRRMREMSNDFEKQAMQDPLSGLLNRRGMLEELQREFDRSKRYQNELTVMMCDIDHFKKINDQYGHDKGDETIKELADIFKSGLRKQDSIARWGGEEYLLLLPETNGEQALQLAEKLRIKIEQTEFHHNNKNFNVTVSFGLYQINQDDSIDQSISNADNNLYKAKEQGRNRCILG